MDPGLRTAGYPAAGDGGDGLYKRIGAAPGRALDLQSADGAYWELVARTGAINVLQAGADPTGVADSIQAFRNCVDFARYNISNEQSGAPTGRRSSSPRASSTGPARRGRTPASP